MERLVIHFGLHKTGTTAVQQYLEANAVELRRRGAAYIALDRMRGEVTPLLYDAEDRMPKTAKHFLGGFPAPTLILSDENIAGGIDDIAAGSFYPAARSRVTSIVDALTETDVHLVLTLRDPVDLIPGLYSEYLRLRDFISFDSYVGKIDLANISLWETFGWIRSLPRNATAHILPYEARFGSGVAGVAAAILRAALGSSVGFDLRTFYESKVLPSFTAEEIEVAAVIASESNAGVASRFLGNLDEMRGRFGERRYAPVEPSVAAVLSDRYEEDLIRFGVVPSAA